MQRLKLAIINILLFFTIFFNIERIDIGQDNAINIQTFVYIISFIAAFSVIIIPNLWRQHVAYGYILWLVIYFAIKFWYNLGTRPILGGINTYITITEIVMVSLTVTLAHNLATHLSDAEETIKNLLMVGYTQQVKQLENANEDIDIELYRSRRNNSPLTVMVIDVSVNDANIVLNQTVEEIINSTRKQYISMSLAKVLRKAFRITDILLHQSSSGRFVLVSPETNADQAKQMITRLTAIAKEEINITPQFGYATFPEDAYTFEELLNLAEKNYEVDISEVKAEI